MKKLIVVTVVLLMGAFSVAAEDLSRVGTPIEYFIGEWVTSEPAPRIMVNIEEYIGTKNAGGIVNDYYRGKVHFPEEFAVPAVSINQIPDYQFTLNEVFYFSMAGDKDPNAICVTRVDGNSAILIRAVFEAGGQKAYVKIQGNGQKEHDLDKMVLLMLHVQWPNGDTYINPGPKSFDIIEFVRQGQ